MCHVPLCWILESQVRVKQSGRPHGAYILEENTKKGNKQTVNNITLLSDKGWEENKTECCEGECLVGGG